MIYQKIFITEQHLKVTLETDMRKMDALENIKKLLNKVNNSVETIPATNPDRLHSLLTDLKGNKLNDDEKTVLEEILRA